MAFTRFVPQRPDIGVDKPPGENSPEYEAFELCGPKEVLVMSSVGPWESVGGDIKFLRLQQRAVILCLRARSLLDFSTRLFSLNEVYDNVTERVCSLCMSLP